MSETIYPPIAGDHVIVNCCLDTSATEDEWFTADSATEIDEDSSSIVHVATAPIIPRIVIDMTPTPSPATDLYFIPKSCSSFWSQPSQSLYRRPARATTTGLASKTLRIQMAGLVKRRRKTPTKIARCRL